MLPYWQQHVLPLSCTLCARILPSRTESVMHERLEGLPMPEVTYVGKNPDGDLFLIRMVADGYPLWIRTKDLEGDTFELVDPSLVSLKDAEGQVYTWRTQDFAPYPEGQEAADRIVRSIVVSLLMGIDIDLREPQDGPPMTTARLLSWLAIGIGAVVAITLSGTYVGRKLFGRRRTHRL